MRDFSDTFNRITIPTMVDQRLAPIYDHLRQSEIFQAAHRLRPLVKPKKIVILSTTPVEGFNPMDILYSTRSDETVSLLCTVTKEILNKQRYATRKDIADIAKVGESTAGNYFTRILKMLNAKISKVQILSDRYPNGRTIEAIVIASQPKLL